MSKSLDLESSKMIKSPRRLVFDSATLYEMVSLFSLKEAAYGWARSGAEALTTSFIGAGRIEIAEAPSPSGPASELYGDLTNCMRQKLHRRLVVPNLKTEVDTTTPIKETHAWVEANALDIANAYLSLRADKSFHPWLHFAQRTAWAEHSNRLGALFDESFLPQIDAVLKCIDQKKAYGRNVPNLESLRSLLNLSRNLQVLPNGIIDLSSADIEGLEHAYVVSAIIRGYFHQQVVAYRSRRPGFDNGAQLTRHPFRDAVFARVKDIRSDEQADGLPFGISNTQSFLSKIILADALKADSAEGCVYRWVESVEVAVRAVDNSIDLKASDNDDQAFSKAVLVARRLGLIVDNKSIDKYVGATILLGAGVSTFTYMHFQSLHMPYQVTALASIVSSPIFKLAGINDRLAETVKQTLAERQLKDLRFAGDGLVSYANYRLPASTEDNKTQAKSLVCSGTLGKQTNTSAIA